MTTGKHDVCDVFCRTCGGCVGWGYERAWEVSEAYKVGKYILELEMCTSVGREREWVVDVDGGLRRRVVSGSVSGSGSGSGVVVLSADHLHGLLGGKEEIERKFGELSEQ